MAWYKAGSVTVTLWSATVTGAGTDFVSNARVGDAFIGPNGTLHEVTNVASATVLSISPVYGGATVSNAVYGIIPVQGYVKQLVDQAGQILTQWGSTLAGLGPVASQSVVPVAMGGTGGTTAAAARNALGLKSASLVDAVGDAAAGAIIETGTNAGGSYTKFADGTLLCSARQALNVALNLAQDGMYINTTASLGFPATFIDAPEILLGCAFQTLIVQPYAVSSTSYQGLLMSMTPRTVSVTFIMIAKGKWK